MSNVEENMTQCFSYCEIIFSPHLVKSSLHPLT